ncbi:MULTISPECIES: hypothetical protein [unclassified Novosphingobium]|uniref:hypothetical protein n=1 Tax=unclassified Novosphingobium TaxID=2644732 RepID=UPI0025F162D6|nr:MULTISPECIES: hypothetical protein [unclassified Novosphingobium]HQV04858.1 hypothetical protein [Novosphingobium sp.]
MMPPHPAIEALLDPPAKARVKRVFETFGLPDISGKEHCPRLVAIGWREILDNRSSIELRGEAEWAAVYGGFVAATVVETYEMRRALSDQMLGFAKTRTEMMMRAGSGYFGVGRKIFIADGRDASLLEAAIAILNQLLTDRGKLTQAQLRLATGMRGVSRILLCRTRSDEIELEEAFDDLYDSYELGNDGAECQTYLRECLVRRLELGFDHAAHDSLAELLGITRFKDRQYYSDVYKWHMASLKPIESGDPARVHHVEAAIAACSKALTLQDSTNENSDYVFHGYRGHTTSLRWSLIGDAAEQRMLEDIEAALPDLRLAAAHGFGGADLSLALLRHSGLNSLVQPDQALADLDEAEASLHLVGSPELRDKVGKQIAASKLELALREAIAAHDNPGILAFCNQLLAIGTAGNRWHFSALLGLHQSWSEQLNGTIELGITTKAVIDQVVSFVDELEETSEHTGLCLSYAAGLSRRLDADNLGMETYRLYTAAIDILKEPNASLLSQAADYALRLSKLGQTVITDEDAPELIVEAIAYFERAQAVAVGTIESLPDSFSFMVSHSKLGEAYLRAGIALAGPDAHQKAIFHFQKAKAYGNQTPHLLGLLGDAYYRQARAARDPELFKQALELKLQAREQGQKSREQCSMIARIHEFFYEQSGDPAHLREAIEAALSAHCEEPNWPWPLFQLAGYAERPASALSQLIAPCPELPGMLADVREKVLAGKRQDLLDAAVHRAASSDEFKRKLLGGRSQVFFLEDPHRLLSSAMVLKPMGRADAQKEIDATKKFASYLGTNTDFKDLLLPKPIAMIDYRPAPANGRKKPDIDSIYAMERESGRDLGRYIFKDTPNGYAGSELVMKSLDFLRIYHDWCGINWDDDNAFARKTLERFKGNLSKIENIEAPQRAAEAWFKLLPSDLPVSKKKDAHPENWIVDRRSRIVMIDLEASKPEIVFRDISQLIDDYPVFANTSEGWNQRLDLVKHYCDEAGLDEFDAEERERAYTAFAIKRAAFGYTFVPSKMREAKSSAGRKRLQARRRHYAGLARFLAANSRFAEARFVAQQLATAFAK